MKENLKDIGFWLAILIVEILVFSSSVIVFLTSSNVLSKAERAPYLEAYRAKLAKNPKYRNKFAPELTEAEIEEHKKETAENQD